MLVLHALSFAQGIRGLDTLMARIVKCGIQVVLASTEPFHITHLVCRMTFGRHATLFQLLRALQFGETMVFPGAQSHFLTENKTLKSGVKKMTGQRERISCF